MTHADFHPCIAGCGRDSEDPGLCETCARLPELVAEAREAARAAIEQRDQIAADLAAADRRVAYLCSTLHALGAELDARPKATPRRPVDFGDLLALGRSLRSRA